MPVQCKNGFLIEPDRFCGRSTVRPVGPAGPVRFLKHWFFSFPLLYLIFLKAKGDMEMFYPNEVNINLRMNKAISLI